MIIFSFFLFIAKTLNKFKANKDYFAGSGHSLKGKSETKNRNQNSAFRRESTNSTQTNKSTVYNTKFSEKDKSSHFSGQGHKLC